MRSPFERRVLTRAQRRRLVESIARAERGHRGEIQVYIEDRYSGDGPVARARELFEELGLDETAGGTGVLLYIAAHDRRAAVWAGPGVYGAEEPGFWMKVIDEVAGGFRRGAPADGIDKALASIGQLLTTAAPGEDVAGNELPDQVIVR